MRHAIRCLVCVLLIGIPTGCRRQPDRGPATHRTMPTRDINEVLRDHDRELMSIPGVAGVYVGVLDDDKTPCLRVAAVKKTPELERKIPKAIDGYRVLVEETGEFRPMRKK